MKNDDVIFIDSGDDDDHDKKNHFDEDNEKDYSAYNISTDDDNEYKPLSPFSYETTDDRMDDYQYKPLSPFSYETTDDRMDDYQYKPLSPFSNETSDVDDCEYNPSSPFSDTSGNSSLAPSRRLCRHPDVWPDSAFNDDGKPISSVFKNFHRLTPVKCDKGIPFDIDGLGVYIMSPKENCAKIYSVKDGRPWNKDVPTKWAGRATCKEDLKCSNVNCLYWTEFGHPNTTQFETKKNEKICAICQYAVESQFCGAQRYVIYMENTAIVCHEGNHTCTAIDPLDINKDEIKKAFKENPKLTASQYSNLRIAGAIRQKMDWEELDKEAVKLVDRKKIANLKQSATKELYESQDDFVALWDFKKYCVTRKTSCL